MSCKHELNCRRKRRRGFTLVELMVVVVIIGLLAGAVTFSVRSYLIASKQNIAKLEISKIHQAIDTYYTAYDRYPSNEEGLEALIKPSPKFPEGILDRKTIPRDPWNNPYQYNHPGKDRHFDIVTFGADGREGGEGADRDLSNADLEDDGSGSP